MKYLKTYEKFENVNIKEYYSIQISGEFDTNNNEFDSFNEAMEYLSNNFVKGFVIDGYNKPGIQGYKIYKMKREKIDETEYETWLNAKKYNL